MAWVIKNYFSKPFLFYNVAILLDKENGFFLSLFFLKGLKYMQPNFPLYQSQCLPKRTGERPSNLQAVKYEMPRLVAPERIFSGHG